MTPLHVIGAAELREKVHFVDLIEAMAEAFRLSSEGRAQNGQIVFFPGQAADTGDIYIKTGAVAGRPLCVVKIAPWFATNLQRGHSQGGFWAVLDAETGHTRAILEDEHYLSDIRTAAAGALVARLFAPENIDTVALLGAGTQAWWQVQALYAERRFSRLSIWARDAAKAADLAGRLSPHLPGVTIVIAASAEAAVRVCDVLITATQSREPIVRLAWLRPGAHVTAVGADDATKCELEPNLLRHGRTFVDDKAIALNNGDVGRAVNAGAAPEDIITGEIGDVLLGRLPARLNADDITVAKLVGLGVQDLLTAEYVLRTVTTAARDQSKT